MSELSMLTPGGNYLEVHRWTASIPTLTVAGYLSPLSNLSTLFVSQVIQFLSIIFADSTLAQSSFEVDLIHYVMDTFWRYLTSYMSTVSIWRAITELLCLVKSR